LVFFEDMTGTESPDDQKIDFRLLIAVLGEVRINTHKVEE
jgi:hypothetical protein